MKDVEQSVTRSLVKILEIEKSVKDFKAIKVGVLISGGVDSMLLLDLITKMAKPMNVYVVALHVAFTDFNSHLEATSLVEEICSEKRLHLIKEKSNIVKGNTSIKLEARAEMKQLCYNSHCNYIFTGHHKDDQIETILFRLLRGTGLDGLGGMTKMSSYIHNNVSFYLCKPFLDISKEKIYQIANTIGLKYVEDESNKVNDTDRNYLRNVVLPVIDHRFNLDQLLLSVNNIKNYSTLNDVSNIDIFSGNWEVSEFFKLSIGNKIFIVKEYLRKVHGFNINRGMYKQLTLSFQGDISNLKISLGKGLVLEKIKDKLTVYQAKV